MKRPWAFLLLLLLLFQSSRGMYVSYEERLDFARGETIPLKANKLTSALSLSSVDYSHLPVCGGDGSSTKTTEIEPYTSKWNKAVSALHGDAIRSEPAFEIRMKENVYCGQLCVLDLSNDEKREKWQDAIRQDLHYNWVLDRMPAAYRYETDKRVAIRYWGGIPVGRRGESEQERQNEEQRDSRFNNSTWDEFYIHNHINIDIMYWKAADNRYRIVRTTMQPFSIQHMFDDAIWPAMIGNSIASCDGNKVHTNYNELLNKNKPPKLASGKILVTYDVKWTEWKSSHDPQATRWNVFLTMDDGIPVGVQVLGLLFAILINVVVFGSLIVWVMRDLSYKPLAVEALAEQVDNDGDDEEEEVTQEQAQEIQLWPLSTRVFFPPAVAPVVLCVCCGTGAQILLSAFIFIFFYRVGVINASLGASIVTPGAIIYCIMSLAGGYVTARLYRIFHGKRIVAMEACFFTAAVFPIFGIIILHLVYDVFPSALSPNYNAVSSSVPLILLWLFVVFPLAFLGGYFGYKHGPIQYLPISQGSQGYQDLSLQDSNDEHENRKKYTVWRKYCRIPLLFLVGGILPVACTFVEYAYGIAGPVYVGYFSDKRLFSIISFVLFNTCVGGVALLLYYRQIRSHNYSWWWSSFIAGSSSGIYIFILSLSWLLADASNRQVSSGSMAVYSFWFLFLSFGVSLMTGFVGVASCLLFNRALYSFAMRRAKRQAPQVLYEEEPDTETEEQSHLFALQDAASETASI